MLLNDCNNALATTLVIALSPRTENAEQDFRSAERRQLTPTVTTLKRTRYYTTRHNGISVTTEVKEYTKKTTYVYPDGSKPVELDSISLKSDCVQEKSKVSKKFTPIGNAELDAVIDSKDPFELSRLDTDSHTHVYNLCDDRRSDTTSFTSKDFQTRSDLDLSAMIEMETSLNHPGTSPISDKPSINLKFEKSDRNSPKLNRLSYNQALKDEVVQSDKSSASYSSSSSKAAKSATFNDTSSRKSDGTHKSSITGRKGSSFFPSIFNNICKGPDTKSVDTQDAPESLPVGLHLSCEEETVESSVLSSIHVSKDSLSSTKTSDKSSEKKSKPRIPMCPPFGRHQQTVSPVQERHLVLSPTPIPERSPQVIYIPLLDVYSENDSTEEILDNFDIAPEAESDDSLEDSPDIEPVIEISDIPIVVDEPAIGVDALPELAFEIPAMDTPSMDLDVGLSQPRSEESDSKKKHKTQSEDYSQISSIKSKSEGNAATDSGEETLESSIKLETSTKSLDILSSPTLPSLKGPELFIKSTPKEESTEKTSKTSHVLKIPLEIHPKAVKVPVSEKKKRPFSLCGLGKADLSSEEDPKAKRFTAPSCFDAEPSTTYISEDSDKDDTLKDEDSICSVDSFVMSSSLIRPPKPLSFTPESLVVGLNPDGTLQIDENGCLLDPDGIPLVYLGPDGGQNPNFHPGLGPIVGPDGTVYGPEGKPLLNPDGKPNVLNLRPVEPVPLIPIPPDDEGRLLGPDGEVVVGPDGNPVRCLVDVRIPYIDPAGILHGTDKEPIRDPETGEPIKINLNLDGSIPLNDDGNIVDENGNVVRPSSPIKPGKDPLSIVVIVSGGGVIGPDGLPVRNKEGEPVKTLCPCSDTPLQISDIGELLDTDGVPIVVEEMPVVPMTTYVMPDIGPDGSVLNPDGLPVITPEGVPVLVGLKPDPDFKPHNLAPCEPNEDGFLLDEYDCPLIGPDGSPIKCRSVDIGCPHISKSGCLYGPDDNQILNPETGQPITITLNMDGSLPMDEYGYFLDNNGAPICILKLGEPPLGQVVIRFDGTVLGPSGGPLYDMNGDIAKVPHPDSGEPLMVDNNGSLLDVNGNPIPIPGSDEFVKPLHRAFSLPHVRQDGSLFDIGIGVPCVTYKPKSVSELTITEEELVPQTALPLAEPVIVDVQRAVDLTGVESCSVPIPPPRKKRSKTWWNPCTRGEPDKPSAEPDISSKICSETQSSTSGQTITSDSTPKPAILSGLLGRIRGRKKERAVPKLKRSTSTPASLYSSCESLIVVTYRIRKKRGQSAPPQANRRRPTVVTIDCEYGAAPAHLAPMYLADLVDTLGVEDRVPAPEVVDYHQHVLERIRRFKDHILPGEDGKQNESHIFTSCHCARAAKRSSVGIGTGCDIIQHEEFEHDASPIDPE